MDVLFKILFAINNVKKLTFFYDACEGYIYRLEFYEDLFIFIVMKKLFEEVRCIMLRSYDEMTWILVDYRE